MPFFTALPFADGSTLEVFVDAERREWRELEAAVDPIDGLLAFIIDGHLYVWKRAALHEEVKAHLRRLWGEQTADSNWLPIRLIPALHRVTITTSLAVGDLGSDVAAGLEAAVRGCQALPRRFAGDISIDHAWRLSKAAQLCARWGLEKRLRGCHSLGHRALVCGSRPRPQVVAQPPPVGG